jgi:hypothetical protein
MTPRPHSHSHSHSIGSPTSSTYSPSITRSTGSQAPNIPLTLPRWGGPPPPPLLHHPHHSSRPNSGSITLAKITGPPDRTTSDFYRRDSIDDYTHSSGSGTFSKIKEYELQEYQRAGGYERDRGVSEDPSSIGGGTKKRRRDSEKPLEEMDDRWVVYFAWARRILTSGL